MTKAFTNGDDAEESVPLHDLRGRSSVDSTNSEDLNDLLSDDVSEASSADPSPVDGGRDAWLCLLGCWLVEAVVLGFPLAFGVFIPYYSNHELFKDSSIIPTIGTLARGVGNLGMPFTNPIALKWPQYRRTMCVGGWLLCLVGLMGASFAQQTWQLLLFQGLLYGTGWVICYTPFFFTLNEHWVEKRGLAYGILFGASGVAGMIIPETLSWMLERFGFRTTLRAYVMVVIVISGPAQLLIRPRRSSLQHTGTKQDTPQRGGVKTLRRYMMNPRFLLFAAAVLAQGLGVIVPNLYLPSFAEDLGISASTSSSLLALIALTQVIGQSTQGWVSDKVDVHILMSLTALLPGLAALLLWGPAKSLVYLAPFALIWGFFSTSYSVLYTRMCTFLATDGEGRHDDGTMMLLYGFFSFERGVSVILEGPISSWLIGHGREADVSRYGLGKYATVVWFTVTCMLTSSLAGIGWFWRPKR